jgi:hypothetical protein
MYPFSRTSTLAEIEPFSVQYCLQLAILGCALNKEGGWGQAMKYCLLLDKRLSGRPKETEQSIVTLASSTDSTINDMEWDGRVQKCTIKFNISENFAAIDTYRIVDNRKRQERTIKAAKERARNMAQQEKHVEIIKNLPKMTSGQLIAN